MAVAVVAGIAAVGGAAVSAVVAGTALTFGAAAAAFAIGAGLSVVSRALAPKPKLNTGASLAGLTATVREPATSKKIVYGRSRIGGTVVYIDTTGTDNEYLHLVIAMAGHEIDAFESVYFNDEKVWQGTYQSGWGSYTRIKFYKGDQTTADSDLVSESTSWTSNHILRDTAYLYVRLKYDADQFPNGIPNVSAIVRGKKIYDPRQDSTSSHYDSSVGVNTHRVNDSSTWTWSQNPALAVRDYLVDSKYGLGEDAALINSSALVTAANYCDIDEDSNADPIPQLQINGIVDTANSRKENIDSMLSAMGGMLVYSGGSYFIRAAQYVSPTITIDESVMVGQIQVQTRQSRRSQYNGVKGVFLSKEKNYTVADYPAQISSTYATEDGDPIYLDMPLPFVTDNEQAQRLAKIALLKSRQQTVITVPVNLAGLKFKAGDVIQITNERMGYDQKPFEVVDYAIAIEPSGGIRVDLRCVETASSIYNWLSDDASDFLSGGELSLYDGKTTQPPTSLTATESTRINSDGAVIPTIEVAWTAASDAFVDHYEVEWKQSTASTYKTVNTVGTEYEIPVPVVGVTYNTRVRAVNGLGVRSTYATANVTMGGDTTAPAAPSSPGTSADVHTLVVSWTNPSDLDLSYVEVKRNSVNTEGTATVVGRSSGTSFVDGPYTVATTHYYWVRAVDNSGNASAWVSAGSDTTVAIAEDDIADGAVTIDKFGTGLEPIQVVSSLPGSATAGQMAFLTTDSKLYRYNGTAWTAAIPVGDVSGAGDLAALDTITLSYVTDAGDVAALDSISETYIDDNSITTAKINANAVTAAKIQANTITAAQIAANTITANEIASNTITANQIAANTITAGQIAAGTITATEIASNTITADQIAAGAVNTDELAADSIYGSKINSATTIVAGSGTNTAALSGVYDYRFWAGGETPAINLPFLVHKDGTVYARKMVLKDSAGNELFNSETGFTNLSINQIVTGTGSTAIKVTTYSEAFTDNNGEVEITLSQTSNLKVGIKIDASWDGSDINANQTTAETNAVADIPSQVQLGVGYASSAGGTFVASSTGTFSRVTTLSGTPSDEYLVEVTSFYEPEVIPGGAYIASATVQTDEPTSAVGPFGYILYEYTFSSLPAGTYYFRTTASGTGGSGSNVVNSSYDRTIEITDLTTDGGFVVDGGGSQTVGQADITSVTAGTNLTGGGLSGGVTLNLADDISLSNITLSGYLRGPASFTIDPAAHGDDTGTVVIAGNLQVDGTTTTINSTTLTVNDKNIVLADGAANAAAADGAGITIDGASASLTYQSAGNNFYFSEALKIAGTSAETSLVLLSGDTNVAAFGGKQIVMGYNGTQEYQHSIRTRHASGTTDGNAIDFYVWDYGVDAVGTVGTQRIASIEGGIGINVEEGGYRVGGTTVIDSSRNLYNVASLNVNHTGNLSGTQVYIKKQDENNNLQRWGEGDSGRSTYKIRIDQTYKFIGDNGTSETFNLSSSTGNLTLAGTLTTAGSLGVGTASPDKTLHVSTANNEGIFLEGSSNGVWMDVQSSASELWSMGADVNGWAIYNRTDSLYYFQVKNAGDVNIVSGALQLGGTTAIDSNRRNIYLDSFTGGDGNGIFFRDGFDYNCSITVEDHNGNAADGLHISAYDGVSIGTGANTKSTDLLVDVSGNTTMYGTTNSVGGYQVNGTTVIDSSRNLTNIGTVSSGAITASSMITSGSVGVGGNLDVDGIIDNTRNNGSVAAPSTSDHTAGTRIKFYDGGGNAFYAIGIENNTLWFNSDTNYKFYVDAVAKVDFDGSGVVNAVGGYKVNGTTVIDSSRNLTNIGSINGFTSTAHTVIRSGNTNAALSFSTGDNFAGIGFNRNVTNGAIYDSGTNAFQLQVQGGVFELESYNGAGVLQKAQAWAVDTAGNMTAAGVSNAVSGYQVNGTTVIDSSRNVSNVNLYRFREDAYSVYISPTNSNTINGMWGTAADTGDLWINYRGYQDGTDYFRDFRIGDGKNVGLLHVDGSAAVINIGYNGRATDLNIVSGNYEINGIVVIDPSRNLTNIGNITSTGALSADNLTASNYIRVYDSGSQAFGFFKEKTVTGAGTSNDLCLFAESIAEGGDVHILTGGSATKKFTFDALGNFQIGGTTVIDSNRRNIYLDSFAGGDNNGIFFRTGFTSSSLGYNCSITVQDHNGSSADGLHISGYDGVGIGTGANTYSVDLLVNVAGDTQLYGNLLMGSTTVIDSSRNLLNVTVTSGEAEYGQSLNGNFGQFQAHGTYTDFNTDVAYWGWNYIQGSSNAPAAISNQWYRNRVSLGDAYGFGSASGDYWLEMAYPRYGNGAGGNTTSQLSRGTMWVRTCEAGTEGSWSEIGANLYSGLEIRGTAVIDTSRNLTNIGTISASGRITSTSSNYAGGIWLSPSSGDSYITANRATDTTGQVGFGWYTGGTMRWVNYLPGDATNTLHWYSASTSTNVMTLDTSGNLNLTSGALQLGGTTVIDASRVVKNVASLGIGTASPSKNLHVYTSANEGMFLQGTGSGVWMDIKVPTSELWSMGADGSGWAIYNRTDSAYRFRVENGGDVDVISGNLKVTAGRAQIVGNTFAPNPDLNLYLSASELQFGGNNNGKESNSGQISVGQHQSNSLNFVGMSSGTSSSDRRMDFWVEGGAYFRGNVVATGNVTAYGSTSDRRLKTNIRSIPDALGKLKAVSGYLFDWNENAPADKQGKTEYGVIAQEVEAAGLDELVFEYERPVNKTGGDDAPPEKWKAVHYDKFVPILIEVVKGQQEQIEQLQAMIEELKNGNH